MTYESLMEKYRTKDSFIYGRSVIQIVDKETFTEEGVRKTNFYYQTDRLNRGVITVVNDPAGA
ncbi:MAG TPA: hypothetical protein DHV36_24580 [Desulfobacteraceae bacterium]|nr:hypothetical protein [Desulfobacteraceae bacterium]|tara:strand:- start:202 stop:390 length:189 start_codon:yes stop_codon:yes gene_type:complete